MPSMLEGVRVVEFASDVAALAGKMLAELGAEVLLVEPPGGHRSRRYGPLARDLPDGNNSLWWHYYATSKSSIVADVDQPDDRAALHSIIESADVVIEADDPGVLGAAGISRESFSSVNPRLVWLSVTPFGSGSSRSADPAVDLTLLAAGGAVWNCGYDDHSKPPVRGGGNQAYHIASVWAVKAVLTALLARRALGGKGQHVEVNAAAAVNVTTEQATYFWHVAQATVQRQTCRHAHANPTQSPLVVCGDGGYAHSGVLPRRRREFVEILRWLDELHIGIEDFPDRVFLEMALEHEVVDISRAPYDDEVAAIMSAAREAFVVIASRMPDAQAFFVRGQQAGLTCSPVNTVPTIVEDPHLRARDFFVSAPVGESQTFEYPGAPFVAKSAPWRLAHSAPVIGDQVTNWRGWDSER